MKIADLHQLFEDCREGHNRGPLAHNAPQPLKPPADPAHIALAEEQLEVTFTEELTNLYLATNGGRPIPAYDEYPSIDPPDDYHESGVVSTTRGVRDFLPTVEEMKDAAYPIDFDYVQLAGSSEIIRLYQLSGHNRGAVIKINLMSTGLTTVMAPSLDNLFLAIRDYYVQFGEFAYTPETEAIRHHYQIGDPPAD